MSLISCGTAFFFSDKWSSYPAWRHSMNCKRVAWRWHEIYRSLEDQTCFIFFTFYILIWFLELYISFSWIFDAVSSEKSCPTSVLFFHWIQDSRVFPPADSWVNPDSPIQILSGAAVGKEETASFECTWYSSPKGNLVADKYWCRIPTLCKREGRLGKTISSTNERQRLLFF